MTDFVEIPYTFCAVQNSFQIWRIAHFDPFRQWPLLSKGRHETGLVREAVEDALWMELAYD